MSETDAEITADHRTRFSGPLAGNLWTATASPIARLPTLAGDIETEVAVIGGGATGLSAALHLAETGRRTVLLEAGKPGHGATGRASGRVLPGLKLSPGTIERRLGPTAGPRLVEWSGGAADALFDLIERLRIDCSPLPAGSIQAAYTPRQLRTLRTWSREWRERGADVRDLDRAEVAAMLGTPLYLGGVADARGGSVHPLNYVQGLARAAIELGADIRVDTPVKFLRPENSGWRLGTRAGSVRCENVVLATNAYSGDLVGGLHRSILSVRASEAATRPLSEPVLNEILPGRQAASDRRRMLVTFRISPCGRLIIGGPGGTGEATGLALRETVQRVGAELFGHLGTFEWEYGWSGRVAVTTDLIPHLHEPEAGLHIPLGYSGRGLALGTALGRLVAERVNGRPASTLDLPVTPIRRIPFHGLIQPAIGVGERLISLLDIVERRLG